MLTLRRLGITTGAAAAAAAKAAALCFRGEAPRSVTIPTPVGLRLEILVERVYKSGEWCCGEVRKFSGDNSDVLNGALVRACVKPGSGGLKITCGEGVGIVTRPGLSVPPGECAINPVPRLMITEALREAGLAEGTVLIEVPGGERLAELTMNKDVGIVGGISILGTTGIEFPSSSKEYVKHIKTELEAVRAVSRAAVLAVGNKAVQYARRDFGDAVVKVGDWIGAAVKMAVRMGFEAVTVAGLPGKLVKVAAGAMNTHSKYCDARLETLTYCALAAGVPPEVVARVLGAGSVAEALYHLGGYRDAVLSAIARRAKERLARLAKRDVRVVVYDEGGRRVAEA
jgi:cobalt-precorrin-5B (C1)-methyltransferase